MLRAINSHSKSNALTGLRLGWLIAPLDTLPQIIKMHGWVTSCASTYAQRIAYDVFARNQLALHRPWYVRQRTGVLAAVAQTPLEYVVPDGAFYLCVRVGATDTLAFAEDLITERDVVAVPGHIFGPLLIGWLRTSFVGPLAEFEEGLKRIASLALERGLLETK